MTKLTTIFVLILLVLGTQRATAQEAAVDRPRYTLTLPPGFELVEVAGFKAVCEPANRKAVEEALSALAPTTRPATMPADLLTRLESGRSDVVKQMVSDYALADGKVMEEHFDKLAAELKRLEEFRPPLFYLCTTNIKLKEMLKSGAWTSPSLYYNRLADEVLYGETVPLTLERPMDDAIVAVIIEGVDSPEALKAKLQRLVTNTTAEVSRMISGRAMFLVQVTMIDAVMQEVFTPMKPPVEQQWLGIGLSGLTSAEYGQAIIGSPKRELLLLVAAELRRNPVRMSTIDLLHPAESSALKRQYVAAYADAYRRKSMAAAGQITEQNREAMPALITSLREKPCSSGEDLLKRVKEITSVDLTAAVSAK